jgi:DNA processing protein
MSTLVSSENLDSVLGWIALNLVPGIGPARAHRLAEMCGGPAPVFAAARETLLKVPGVDNGLAARLAAFSWREQAERELDLCRLNRCRIVTLESEDYPSLLRQITWPPPVLYLRGDILPADERALAVVGCRKATPYGLQTARALAGDLAQAGFTIVSGLALGIDAAAHEAALEAGGRTLAVLAHGLNRVYPAEHRDLHDRLISAGAVITEFPFSMQPLKENFPQRNRLISGLAMGVVVVEAARDSGALITARWAADQGREVFAVPGKFDSRESQGTHALIQDGAKLVTGLTDILAELSIQSARRAETDWKRPEPPGLSPVQQKIFQALDGGGMHVDQLAAACGQPVRRLLTELLQLELRGQVQAAPGGCYYWNR